MSQAKQVKSFVAELNRCASRQGSALFLTSSLVDIAGRVSLEVADFHGFIGVLNEQNYLLKKGPRLWQLRRGGGVLRAADYNPAHFSTMRFVERLGRSGKMFQ